MVLDGQHGDRMINGKRSLSTGLLLVSLRYQPELDVERNFSPHGWLFHDENKNTVAILSATLREGMLYTSEPYADVTVFERNGMMLGWIQSDKIITTGDLWFTPKGTLEAMPSKLRFAVTCPHLSVYGGWLDQDHDFWTCFGCGKRIVFPDHRK